MATLTTPSVLDGRWVRLERLDRSHLVGLVAAAQERSSFGYTHVPDGREAMADDLARWEAEAAAGRAVAFAQVRQRDGQVVGRTTFLHPWWDPGRDDPVEVEIGATWLGATAQRTPVNTEAKLLLLTHAFDTWGVARVALCTDARNQRSRAAIERLGARFEGIARRHRPSAVSGEAGGRRDTAVYAVTAEDWPGVSTDLRRRLA